MGWLQWIAVAAATYVRFKEVALKGPARRQQFKGKNTVPYRTTENSVGIEEQGDLRLQRRSSK